MKKDSQITSKSLISAVALGFLSLLLALFLVAYLSVEETDNDASTMSIPEVPTQDEIQKLIKEAKENGVDNNLYKYPEVSHLTEDTIIGGKEGKSTVIDPNSIIPATQTTNITDEERLERDRGLLRYILSTHFPEIIVTPDELDTIVYALRRIVNGDDMPEDVALVTGVVGVTLEEFLQHVFAQ